MKKVLVCLRCGHRWLPRTERPVQCPACHSAWWDQAKRRNPKEGIEPFALVFSLLNHLKRRRIIRDWAIYGATAFMYYAETILTRDMDVFIVTDLEQEPGLPEYRKVLRALEEYASVSKVDAGTFDVDGRLLQVFQARGNPFWEDVVREAVKDIVAGEPVKVASREHLILLALARFSRSKDWPRLAELYQGADKRRLRSLLRRFDEGGALGRRLETLKPWLR